MRITLSYGESALIQLSSFPWSSSRASCQTSCSDCAFQTSAHRPRATNETIAGAGPNEHQARLIGGVEGSDHVRQTGTSRAHPEEAPRLRGREGVRRGRSFVLPT